MKSTDARRPAPAAATGSPLPDLRTADGVFVVDTNQRIRQWSDSAERILGFTAGEVLGRPCFDVFVGQDFQGHPFCRSECPVARNSRRGRPVKDYDVVVDTKDGRRLALNNSVVLWNVEGAADPLVMHLFREVKDRSGARFATPPRRSLPSSPRSTDEIPVSTPLSRRELAVLRLVAAGLPTREVAEASGVSYYTARNQVSSLLRKLNARSRLEAVARASEAGLL